MKLIDIIGKKYGRLTIVNRIPGLFGRHVLWNCLCECGNEVKASSQNIRTGHTQSCGCRLIDIMRKTNTSHGLTPKGGWALEYKLWSSAKYRAARNGLVFSISPLDIIIPEKCPLLDIPIHQNKRKLGDSSPTLDRIRGDIGYTKDNIWVVSYKANRSKNNLSIDEMRKLLKNLESKLDLTG